MLHPWCWNTTSGQKRTTSPLSGSLSKKPCAVGKGNDVTDVITNKAELTITPVNSNHNNSNLLDRIYPPISDIFNPNDHK
ncbi:hypothetical protein H4Q26_012300 [Puccinia striiformis f. sp. tritici PST-130]|nr:hypothetical protein H4Q26_012300 [Puccinia striiformis f. sp. tritici PST-130]